MDRRQQFHAFLIQTGEAGAIRNESPRAMTVKQPKIAPTQPKGVYIFGEPKNNPYTETDPDKIADYRMTLEAGIFCGVQKLYTLGYRKFYTVDAGAVSELVVDVILRMSEGSFLDVEVYCIKCDDFAAFREFVFSNCSVRFDVGVFG